jgi:ubiquinone/menaquinone biosynthesis C-methylase UbiE
MLAGAFERVIATDVSPKMLEYARERIRSPNIDWQVCDGSHIPAANESVDAVFSCHVFQHFPSTAAQLAVFREVHRVLKPGGTFFVHLHTHVFPGMNARLARLTRAAYKLYTRCAAAWGVVRHALMRRAGKGFMRDISYEIPQLFVDLEVLGFADVSLSTIRVRGFRSIHPCVLGKKPVRDHARSMVELEAATRVIRPL